VPIAAVLTPSDVLTSEHFTAIGAMTDADLAPGVSARVPVGYFVVDGRHTGFRAAPGLPGSSEPCWRAIEVAPPTPTATAGSRPFDGLRIVDLGIIVAGGELSRLFADLGAEVIKVESAAYPDGLRQKRDGQAMSESFAWTHRNNLGLGLDLRTAAGADIFARLVAASDAVFANFKPGTLASLGFPYRRLQQLNPRIVLAESSAFGDAGPWSARMGYGPLVRATTGVTRLWTAEDDPSDSARHNFYDATTIFPDHVVGRITAIGALAALIHRDRSGHGARIHVSQAEAVVNQLDTMYVTQAALEAGGDVCDETGVHAVYPCAGDDEWCVISIRSDEDWRAVAAVVGRPELADDPRWGTGESRAAHRGELVAELSAWTRTQPPSDAAEALQSAGVPAGPMYRASDLHDDPQLRARKLFADMVHPLFDHPFPAEAGPAPFLHIPQAAQRPAPLPGADTRAICRDILALDAEETERLIADGVLFTSTSGGERRRKEVST
jgi:crotonobetainyl-CoA:carnitine CoA-transferase CaiB-like acyl-CoA transferase